jgi:hypothetical protein
MTRIELIRGIGDTLTRLDVLRGGLLPRDPQRVALDDLRLLLDDRQRRLSQQLFDETAEAYRRATLDVARVNENLLATIDELERLATTIQNLRRLLVAVDGVLNVAVPFV